MSIRTRVRTRSLAVASASALVLAAAVATPLLAQAETVFEDDFEAGTLGEPPPDWSVTAVGGSVTVETVADETNPDNQAMCLEREDVNTSINATHGFDVASGEITVETRVRAGQTNALFNGPVLRDSLGRTIIHLGLHHENGQLSTLQGGWNGLAPYEANTWHDLRIEADTESDTYDVYWDDVLVGEGESFNVATDDLASIQFTVYAWTAGTACYDALLIDAEEGGSTLPPDEEEFLTPEELLDEMSNGVFAPIRDANTVEGGIDLEGDFDQWRQLTGVTLPANDDQIEIGNWGGPDDLSAEAYFAHDDENFYLGIEVTDDVHEAIAGNNYNGDGIQFSFADSVFGSFRSEYGIALVDGEVDIQRYSDGLAVDPPSAVEAVVNRDDDANLTTYALRIPWTAVMADTPEAGVLTPFTFLVNENDGSGRKGWLEWTPGIGAAKDIGAHARIDLLDAADPWSAWLAGPTVVNAGDPVQLALLAPNFGEDDLDLTIDIPAAGTADHPVTVPAGQALRLTFTITVDESTDVTATIAGDGQVREPAHRVDALLSGNQIIAMLNDIEDNVLPDLQALLGQAETAGLATDYETVNADSIELFIPFARADVDNDRRDRAQYMAETMFELADEATDALNAYLDGTATPFETSRYVTGPTEIDGYSWLGETTAGENEPVFFNGYGMFGTVLNDIPKFPGLGTNIVDHVFGPNEVIVPPGEATIPGWSRSPNGSARIGLDDTEAFEGEQSLSFEHISGQNSLVQSVPVTPGETYEFSAWFKAENAESPRVISKNFQFAHYLPTGTYDWQQVSFEVEAGDFESLQWRLWQEAPGTIWMDNASITLVGDDENLLVNGDFEDGEPGDGDLFGIDMTAINNKLLPALQRAEDNNIAVNITLAPHRWPTWTHNAFPGIRNDDALFAYRNFDPEHPVAQEIIETFVDVTMEAIKDSPALVSVTIGSEPNYLANTGEYHTANWRAHAEDLYATIGAANDRWGTDYASFDELEVPAMSGVTGSPLYYDYVTFKEGKFLEHHQLMRDAVHAQVPDMPTHIKIMGWGAGNRNALRDWAVDVEAFSDLTEISGNDNGVAQQGGPQAYLESMMLYDTQRSMAEQPIFNSEDHVGTDGDERYIPEIAASVENQMWIGALHGRTASTIWVWDRSYDVQNLPWAQGSILNRPDAVANVGHASLEINRLASEVLSFVEEDPDVALLYSRVPLLYSDPYWSALTRSYNAMSATGQHVGFVTDSQVAGGGLNDYELLVVPEVTNLPAETLAEIRAWQEAGGRVVTIGDPAGLLTGDEYDDALPADDRDAVLAGATQVPSTTGAPELTGILFGELADLGLDRVIAYDVATGEPATDLEWRIADHDGQTLLSVINLSESDRQVTVEIDGVAITPAVELISDTEPESSTLSVGSLGHYLYELDETVAPDVCAATGEPADERPTVVIGGRDSGVPNYEAGDGCTVNDLITEDWPNVGDLVRHVTAVASDLVADGVLTARERGDLIRAAAAGQ
jgi:hypothetical protein